MNAGTEPRASEALLEALDAVGRRRAGSDAERRAALTVATALRGPHREAEVQTFWCRPNWALAHAWHTALGIAGSLLAVAHPHLGGALVLGALLCVLTDAVWGVSPGRRLTPERASQNVLSRPRSSAGTGPETTRERFRLVLTANLDAGATGLVYRAGMRDRTTRLRRARTRGRAPGWQAWLVLTLAAMLLAALLRLRDPHGAGIAVLQLVGTVGLVVALALLLELAGAQSGPGASDNATGVMLALAAVRALDDAPPTHASVEVVLTGAGDGQGIGLRRLLRARRRELTPQATVVVGLGPAGGGDPAFFLSDGSLAPLAFSRRLTGLAREVAAADPELGLRAERGRGVSPALPARAAGLPAITICCLAPDGTPPRSHRSEDRPGAVDLTSFRRALDAVLLLIDGIDDELGGV